jgi:hypothetical protein
MNKNKYFIIKQEKEDENNLKEEKTEALKLRRNKERIILK